MTFTKTLRFNNENCNPRGIARYIGLVEFHTTTLLPGGNG